MRIICQCLASIAVSISNLQAADIIMQHSENGSTQSTTVGRASLIHTAQVFGRLPAETLDQIDASITDSDISSAVVAKLNVYGANQEAIDAARAAIAKRYADRLPATSYVVGKLADSQSTIAMDAVAVADNKEQPDATRRVVLKGRSSTLLPGSRVYISGQAEKGTTPAEATRLTLESLHKTLLWLGCTMGDVIQVKSFLTPISSVGEVKRELELAFGAGKVPPLVFVEWESALPIEIELIAAAPSSTEGVAPSIEYLTPPGMTASPVYCRVTKINSHETIYVSGLYSAEPGSGADEVKNVLEQLSTIVQKSGSGLRHLAKATYYVSSADASSKLNELRPNFYDPQRPPAASKAFVTSVGMLDRALTIDMIAVPARD